MKKKSRSATASSRHAQSGHIRIISGQFRGRKLPVKNLDGLRPTTDRVKETLFNWLMQDVRDAKVLDCFAGAGSLGFEALSRFAAFATLIELDQNACEQLKQNTELLKLDNCEVINQNTLHKLEKNTQNQKFDLVFIDPPFGKNLAEPCCQLLEQQQWLSQNALIYVEIETNNTAFVAPSNWQLLKEKKAGQAWARLYRKE